MEQNVKDPGYSPLIKVSAGLLLYIAQLLLSLSLVSHCHFRPNCFSSWLNMFQNSSDVRQKWICALTDMCEHSSSVSESGEGALFAAGSLLWKRHIMGWMPRDYVEKDEKDHSQFLRECNLTSRTGNRVVKEHQNNPGLTSQMRFDDRQGICWIGAYPCSRAVTPRVLVIY